MVLNFILKKNFLIIAICMSSFILISLWGLFSIYSNQNKNNSFLNISQSNTHSNGPTTINSTYSKVLGVNTQKVNGLSAEFINLPYGNSHYYSVSSDIVLRNDNDVKIDAYNLNIHFNKLKFQITKLSDNTTNSIKSNEELKSINISGNIILTTKFFKSQFISSNNTSKIFSIEFKTLTQAQALLIDTNFDNDLSIITSDKKTNTINFN